MTIIGWVANIFLIIGYYMIAKQNHHGFALSAVGDVLWAYEGVIANRLDLFVVCVLFTVIAIMGWWQWDRTVGSTTAPRRSSSPSANVEISMITIVQYYLHNLVFRMIKWRNGESLALYWCWEKTPYPLGWPYPSQLLDGFWNYGLRKWSKRDLSHLQKCYYAPFLKLKG